MKLRDVEEEFKDRVLVENTEDREDHEYTRGFTRLKGRPSRPFDKKPSLRTEDEYQRVSQKLGPDFFRPFNRLLKLVNIPEIEVDPRQPDEIARWNAPEFIDVLVKAIEDRLDARLTARLVPYLVQAFINLEWEDRPRDSEWIELNAIVVPGSRTLDRAAEAHRAYRYSHGNAYMITSGKAPYYDRDRDNPRFIESQASAAYLRLLGVPRPKIIIEQVSMDTDENAEFLVEALHLVERMSGSEARKVLLVTSPFHLARYRLNVELTLDQNNMALQVFSIGSRASRYWAETYFLEDAKSGYDRTSTMKIVLNEYLKIAFDLCAGKRPPEAKMEAFRN